MIQKLSKSIASLIRSLSIPKYRQMHNLFVAEGEKIFNEILKSKYKIKYLVFNSDKTIPKLYDEDFDVYKCNSDEMKKISNLKNPPSLLTVVEIPNIVLNIENLKSKLSIAIEDIQDPGNLGTIIRICSWFGIENIICSKNSVDVYNPKVVQATMGEFTKVNVHYIDFAEFLPNYVRVTQHQIFGTFLDGENIYSLMLPQNALVVFGNEGHGITEYTAKFINKKLFIPPFNKYTHPESLNISSAAAIVCSEFRRNYF